ncbi:hypothetical protein [Streptomyces fulvorobeus]|uniref:Uncharacterized protein n=1 Tax=Streptomyces fulvorobeus TaxID=284028 RepID=A0A7Y9KW26_9ACTN|nr:hypothetical protein [Streptomyces fulvorobeus]NYE41035.1 hypothetical protein [Streptomyces fulvorobeus]
MAGGTVAVRIGVSGTHTRRDDLEALHTWLQSAPDLEEVREADQLAVGREVSAQQTEGMSGELIQDIVLVVSVEVARNVIDKVWRSVETWVRNRRRFADPEETPRVTLDGPATGPGAGLGRDTDRDGAGRPGGNGDGQPGGDTGGRPGGGGRTRGDDEAGEV